MRLTSYLYICPLRTLRSIAQLNEMERMARESRCGGMSASCELRAASLLRALALRSFTALMPAARAHGARRPPAAHLVRVFLVRRVFNCASPANTFDLRRRAQDVDVHSI